jgi:hypothetical protein
MTPTPRAPSRMLLLPTIALDALRALTRVHCHTVSGVLGKRIVNVTYTAEIALHYSQDHACGLCIHR